MNFFQCNPPSVEIRLEFGQERKIMPALLDALMCEIMFGKDDMMLSRRDDNPAHAWFLTDEERDIDIVPPYSSDLRFAAHLMQWATVPRNCSPHMWGVLADEIGPLHTYWYAPAYPLMLVCAFGRVFRPELAWQRDNFGLDQVNLPGAFSILFGERNTILPYKQPSSNKDEVPS